MQHHLSVSIADCKDSAESADRDCSLSSSFEDYGDAILVDEATLETDAHTNGQRVSIIDMQAAVRTLLTGVGEDPDRQGLRDTPKRVAKAWFDISAGYTQDVDSILGQALFDEAAVSSNSGGMVMVRDIEFASTSAANLLPFHGRCHIAYMPSRGVVLGLSKFARLTGLYARRFQHQQQFTDQILRALTQHLGPAGTAVIVEAKHMAEGPDAPTHLTSAAQGLFDDPSSSCTAEFLALLRLSGVPVSPAQGLPSAPCSVLDQVEKSNVVGRGLRHSAKAVSGLARAPVRSCGLLRLQQPLAAQHQLPVLTKPRLPLQTLLSREASKTKQEDTKQAMDVKMHDAITPGRPTLEQMEGAVQVLLEGVVPPSLLQEVDHGAEEYVHQMMTSTSGYDSTLETVLQESAPQSPNSSHSVADCNAWADQYSSPLAAARGLNEFHVRFASQCEHHLLPFYGTVHAAYIPRLGAPRLSGSQLEAVVVMYSQRLQIQERLTQQIASAIESATQCKGALVVVDGLHMCMVARGVEKHASSTTTVAARGSLADDGVARSQLLLSLCIN